MTRFVVVACKPKAGMSEALEALVRKHVSILRSEGLASDRPVSAMRTADGTIVEVFEWNSAEAIQAAHSNAAVQALWGEFGAACDYVPLSQIPEAQKLFAEFEPIELE